MEALYEESFRTSGLGAPRSGMVGAMRSTTTMGAAQAGQRKWDGGPGAAIGGVEAAGSS